IPAIALEPHFHALAEGEICMTFDGDPVAVIDPAQVRQAKMTSQRSGLAGNPFHHVAVAADHVDIVIEQSEIRSIVVLGKPARPDCHADAVTAALPKWASGRFDAGGQPVFRMAGCDAADLPEILDVVEAD